MSWTVLPEQPAARKHSFRWPRHPAGTLVVEPPLEVVPEEPELTPALYETVTQERDDALRRIEQLERMLQMLNREVAVTVDEPAIVWVAPDADVYHRRRRCAGLIAMPYVDGAVPVDVTRVDRSQALDSGRGRCGLCF
jgi:hypothetical protein